MIAGRTLGTSIESSYGDGGGGGGGGDGGGGGGGGGDGVDGSGDGGGYDATACGAESVCTEVLMSPKHAPLHTLDLRDNNTGALGFKVRVYFFFRAVLLHY